MGTSLRSIGLSEAVGSFFASLPPLLLWECGVPHYVVLWYQFGCFWCLGFCRLSPPSRPGLPRRPAHTTEISVAVGGEFGIQLFQTYTPHLYYLLYCQFVTRDSFELQRCLETFRRSALLIKRDTLHSGTTQRPRTPHNCSQQPSKTASQQSS